MRTLPETDVRGKIEPSVEKRVLKIERYAQRLTQGYSAYGGSYLWAPVKNQYPTNCEQGCYVQLPALIENCL